MSLEPEIERFLFFGFFASLAREGKQITEIKGEGMIAG